MMSENLTVAMPTTYIASLGVRETQIAIKLIKDYFETRLAGELQLTRVSAPLYVHSRSGYNDTLNGVEQPVSFTANGVDEPLEIVHSLAKWKRMALYKYGFHSGEGLYTDMNAIRRDEQLDNLHSFYVDQWDWEQSISKQNRTLAYLQQVVRQIYDVFLATEQHLYNAFPTIEPQLPTEIYFITAQELADLYPTLSPQAREQAIAKKKGAVFIMQIGGSLRSGERHGSRAPDYDDWQLNGDIIFWYAQLQQAVELSSMGIRVDAQALLRQLKLAGCEERTELTYHRMLLEGKLPYSIGGGIGQSRMCMFLLQKAHIGEVQASIWPQAIERQCKQLGIALL